MADRDIICILKLAQFLHGCFIIEEYKFNFIVDFNLYVLLLLFKVVTQSRSFILNYEHILGSSSDPLLFTIYFIHKYGSQLKQIDSSHAIYQRHV